MTRYLNDLRIGVHYCRKAMITLIPSLVFFWTIPALGQDTDAEGAIDEVVVTGSYLARPADRPQPIISLTSEDIANEMRSNVGEIFMDLGISQGGSSLNDDTETSASFVNLRGIGARGTLVMLDGQRQTVDGHTAGGAAAVDINNIAPKIMLDRIEILTDGASALYGSDAVAGVVNLITRRDFEGLDVSVEGMRLDRAGTNEFVLGAIFGTSSGSGTSIVAGVEYTDRELVDTTMIYDAERLATGTVSSTGNPGSFTPVGAPSSARRPDPLCGSDALGGGIAAGIPRSTSCGLLLSLGRNQVGATERLLGLTVIDHKINDKLDASVSVGFATARFEIHSGFGIPISIGGGGPGTTPIVPAFNPGVIAANAADPNFVIQDYEVRQRIRSPVSGRPVSYFNEQDTSRVAAALKGEISSNWDWTVTTTYSQNDTTRLSGDTLPDRFQDALNCMGLPSNDTCYNPFANSYLASPGDPEYNDPELDAWMFVTKTEDGHAELRTADILFTGRLGDLRGGPTGLAIGLQTRSQEFGLDFDPISNDGGYAFRPIPSLDFAGERTANAVFGELVMYPTETFETQFAVRHESYNGGVSSTDPKISLLWIPNENVAIRATAGTAFRVPGELQTFGQTVGPGPVATINGIIIDAGAVTFGDPNLLPEESENFTAGVTWRVADKFTFDLNYWKIDFKNLVVEDDPTIMWFNDIADGTIDDPRILLKPTAPSNIVADLEVSDILGFELSYRNQDFLNTDGIDFNFDYAVSAGENDFNVNLKGTYTLSYDLSTEGEEFDGRGSFNHTNLGVPMPDWTGALRFDWRRKNHFARLVIRYIPALTEDSPAGPLTQEIGYKTMDLSYRYSWAGGRTSADFSIVNLTDEETPWDDTDSQTNAGSLYDPRGRQFRLGLNVSF